MILKMKKSNTDFLIFTLRIIQLFPSARPPVQGLLFQSSYKMLSLNKFCVRMVCDPALIYGQLTPKTFETQIPTKSNFDLT